jgi:hypothetical protein
MESEETRQLRLQLDQKTLQLGKSDGLLKKVGKMLQDHIDENKKLKERVAELERKLGGSNVDGLNVDGSNVVDAEEEVVFDSQDMDRQVVEDAKWGVGTDIDIVVPAGRLGATLIELSPGVSIGQVMALPTGEPSPLQGKVPEGAQLVKFDQDDSSDWDLKRVAEALQSSAHRRRKLRFRVMPHAQRPAGSTSAALTSAALLDQLKESEAQCATLECNLQNSRQEHDQEVAYLRTQLQSLEDKLPKPSLSQLERTKAGSGGGGGSGSSSSATGKGDGTASPSVSDRMAAAAGALASPFGTLGLGSGSILRGSSTGSNVSSSGDPSAPPSDTANAPSTPGQQAPVSNGSAAGATVGACAEEGSDTKPTDTPGGMWAGLGALGNTIRLQSPNPLSSLGALGNTLRNMGSSDSSNSNSEVDVGGGDSGTVSTAVEAGHAGDAAVSSSVKSLAEKTMELLDSPLPSGVTHPSSPPRGGGGGGGGGGGMNQAAAGDNAPGTPPPEQQQIDAEMGAYDSMGSPPGMAETPPVSPARAGKPEI